MKNEFRLLRHATLLIRMNGVNLLIDPMLAPKGEMEPVANALSSNRIPLADLPFNHDDLKNLLAGVDAVLVTHTHRDHWDLTAQSLIGKNIPVLCQPADAEKIKSQGFNKVTAVNNQIDFKGLKIIRISGHHGTGETEKQMGEVSGFIIEDKTTTVYIAGDTVWCDEVRDALIRHQPAITIVNSGACSFLTGGPITMTAQDVITVARTLPSSRVFAVHLETVNHCMLNRAELQSTIENARAINNVSIPADGEVFYSSN